MCIFLSSNAVQITISFFVTILVTLRHRCVIMHDGVYESLSKLCKYRQNVPQHYYHFDTLVYGCTGEPPVTTTCPQRPVFQHIKSFQVKSLYLDLPVTEHLSYKVACVADETKPRYSPYYTGV